MKLGFVALASLLLATGCAARLSDEHYFATVRPGTGEVVNVFRVKVEGAADFSNARYISGYYDERAVDLFFNEIKPSETKFFDFGCASLSAEECQNKKEAALATVPVGKDGGQTGTFVMILSTNADAITSTIGSFAESDAVVQSAVFLASRDTYLQARQIEAVEGTVRDERKATYDALANLLTIDASTAAQREAQYLAVLRTAAGAVAPQDPPNFTTVEEARIWFASRPRKVRQ